MTLQRVARVVKSPDPGGDTPYHSSVIVSPVGKPGCVAPRPPRPRPRTMRPSGSGTLRRLAGSPPAHPHSEPRLWKHSLFEHLSWRVPAALPGNTPPYVGSRGSRLQLVALYRKARVACAQARHASLMPAVHAAVLPGNDLGDPLARDRAVGSQDQDGLHHLPPAQGAL